MIRHEFLFYAFLIYSTTLCNTTTFDDYRLGLRLYRMSYNWHKCIILFTNTLILPMIMVGYLTFLIWVYYELQYLGLLARIKYIHMHNTHTYILHTHIILLPCYYIPNTTVWSWVWCVYIFGNYFVHAKCYMCLCLHSHKTSVTKLGWQ